MSDLNEPTSRRSLITKGAVGLGAAWVAPALVSSAAGAATGTAPRSILDWSALYSPGQTPVTSVVGAVTVTHTYANLSGTPPQAGNAQINGGTSGSRSPYQRFQWGGGANAVANSSQSTTLTFSQTVQNVCFELTDIDASTGQWQDFITVSATGPAVGAITMTSNGPFVLGTGPTWNGDPTQGDAGSGTTNGNLDVIVNGEIDSITIIYAQGPFNATASQHIGLFNPSWGVI